MVVKMISFIWPAILESPFFCELHFLLYDQAKCLDVNIVMSQTVHYRDTSNYIVQNKKLKTQRKPEEGQTRLT